MAWDVLRIFQHLLVLILLPPMLGNVVDRLHTDNINYAYPADRFQRIGLELSGMLPGLPRLYQVQ